MANNAGSIGNSPVLADVSCSWVSTGIVLVVLGDILGWTCRVEGNGGMFGQSRRKGDQDTQPLATQEQSLCIQRVYATLH